MIYPREKFEAKTGFNHIKDRLRALCLSAAGASRVDGIEFSSRPDDISHALTAVAQMVAIETSDDPLPLSGVIDISSGLSLLRVPGSFLPAQDILGIYRALRCVADVASFFSRRRHDDGVSSIPELDAEATALTPAPALLDRKSVV